MRQPKPPSRPGRPPARPLADRILAKLAEAGRPCTRGELCGQGVLARGEKSADLQPVLEQLQGEGTIRRVELPRPPCGPMAMVGWDLVVPEAGMVEGLDLDILGKGPFVARRRVGLGLAFAFATLLELRAWLAGKDPDRWEVYVRVPIGTDLGESLARIAAARRAATGGD